MKLVHCFFLMKIMLFMDLLRADFRSWNLLQADVCSWNLLHINFSVREFCTLIFLLVKLILFMDLVALILFVELFASWFCSWNFLQVDLSLIETCTLVFLLVKLVLFFDIICTDFLFVELSVCWILFGKFIACWFFSTWNLWIDLSTLGTDFVHRTCCELIFARGTFLRSDFVCDDFSYWFFSLWKLYVYFSPRIIDFLHLTCCVLIFVHGAFCMLIYLFVKFLIFPFVKLVCSFFSLWNRFCSWNFLHADFLFVKLITCWFFSSLNF